MSRTALEVLDAGLSELGIAAPGCQINALAELVALVAEWGRRINLSGHRGPESISKRLVLDAAALQAQLPDCETLADLGSGAGFPGLPIAILRPDTRVVLVESRERRHHFQRHVIRQLALPNVSALRGRLEAVTPVASDVVIAQAVADPSQLAESMTAWARPGGLVVVPGGTSAREVPGAESIFASVQTLRYRVPLDGPDRTLWVGRVPNRD